MPGGLVQPSRQPLPLYDMKISVRNHLADILDLDDEWMKLAEAIGMPTHRIMLIQQKQSISNSPTRTILNYWICKNPTISTLRTHLNDCRLYRAVQVLDKAYPEYSPACSSQSVVSMGGAGSAAPMRVEEVRVEPLNNHQPAGLHQQSDSMGLPLPPLSEVINVNSLSEAGSSAPPSYWTSMKDSNPQQQQQQQQRGHVGFDLKLHGNSAKIDDKRCEEGVANDEHGWSQCQAALNQQYAGVLANITLFAYEDVKAATRNFSEMTLLGTGGFGKVYQAKLLSSVFAAKVLIVDDKDGRSVAARKSHFDLFMAEVKVLQKVRHKNVIMLAGCSTDGPQMCLIYEYMVNKSLSDWLEVKSLDGALPWRKRLSIMKDAATGLQYLHSQRPPFIHSDIKSANILLGPHFEAKIADFGLTKEATGGSVTKDYTHITYVTNNPLYGTKEYLPDYFYRDYYHCIQTDTHGFGVVIFEVCTGEPPRDNRRLESMLINYVDKRIRCLEKSRDRLAFKDPLAVDWPDKLWLQMLAIGCLCSPEKKKDVPKMKQIQVALEELCKDSQASKFSKTTARKKLGGACRAEPPISSSHQEAVNERAGLYECDQSESTVFQKWYNENIANKKDFTNQPIRSNQGPKNKLCNIPDSHQRRSFDGVDESALISQLKKADPPEAFCENSAPSSTNGYDEKYSDDESVTDDVMGPFNDLDINSDCTGVSTMSPNLENNSINDKAPRLSITENRIPGGFDPSTGLTLRGSNSGSIDKLGAKNLNLPPCGLVKNSCVATASMFDAGEAERLRNKPVPWDNDDNYNLNSQHSLDGCSSMPTHYSVDNPFLPPSDDDDDDNDDNYDDDLLHTGLNGRSISQADNAPGT